MIPNKETFKKLKQLTGFNYANIAEKFGISRQAVEQYTTNTSTIYKNSNKFIVMTMIDIKIKEYEDKIKELEEFKKEVIEV